MEFKKQRVVVKVGTSTITHPSGAPNLRNIEILARTLSDLQDMGHEMILVSSGAIGVGVGKLGMSQLSSLTAAILIADFILVAV